MMIVLMQVVVEVGLDDVFGICEKVKLWLVVLAVWCCIDAIVATVPGPETLVSEKIVGNFVSVFVVVVVVVVVVVMYR